MDKTAKQLWQEADPGALDAAWREFDAAPQDLAVRKVLSRILKDHSGDVPAARAGALEALARDPAIDPANIGIAGWALLSQHGSMLSRAAAPQDRAADLERSTLALTLLHEDVAGRSVEWALQPVRRWLLLSGRWDDFPKLRDGFVAQAALNGGAWPFEADERAALPGAGGFARAFLPERPAEAAVPGFADGVTRAVAEQYESWPYPVWRRVTASRVSTLADDVAAMDPQGPDGIARPADILVAGCGTGRQVAAIASRWPGDRITAIDISEASVALAKARCAEAGIAGVTWQVMDLHRVAELGRHFDAVLTTGVLHHLPDPEAGWRALAAVVKPGGAMHVMVYSLVARMRVMAWRKSLGALIEGPMSDDRLREIRRHIQSLPPVGQPSSRDFQSLAGTHDLLAHRHEDPFDIPRIRRALDALGLLLIHFELPAPKYRVRYRAEFPNDPLNRDFAGWTWMEREYPSVFAGMYDLWCRKPPT